MWHSFLLHKDVQEDVQEVVLEVVQEGVQEVVLKVEHEEWPVADKTLLLNQLRLSWVGSDRSIK